MPRRPLKFQTWIAEGNLTSWRASPRLALETAIISLLEDVSASFGSSDESIAFGRLVDEKAALHLGINGQEFRWRWYRGMYEGDPRPVVQALNELMRTGVWRAPDNR